MRWKTPHSVPLPRVLDYVRYRRIGWSRGERQTENWRGGPEAPVTPECFLASVMLDGEQTSASGGRHTTVTTGVSKQKNGEC